MSVKKIFNATFEQSLNLLDDQLVMYMIKDTEKRSLYNGKRKFLLVVIAIILVAVQYGFVLATDYGMKHPDKDSFVPAAEVNLLPKAIFWIFLSGYLCIWLYTRHKNDRNISTKIFVTMGTCNNYLLWFLLEANLFFITFFLKALSLIGMGIYLLLICIIGYLIIRSKVNFLNKNMLEMKVNEKTKIDNFIETIIQLVMKYGWVIVIVVIVWKFFFPSGDGIKSDIFGFISVLGMWFACNIAFIAAEAYLFFPYLLHGYYNYKYPEEYREWEGKTQLEWYGEKYFNKHIKGTEKEVDEEK